MGLWPTQVDEDRWWRELQLAARLQPAVFLSFTVGARFRYRTPTVQGGDTFFNGAVLSSSRNRSATMSHVPGSDPR